MAGRWEVCTPATAPAFLGTGFYFAPRILGETGMPVGLIDGQFGGTTIEASISPEGFEMEPWLNRQRSYEALVRHADHIAAE